MVYNFDEMFDRKATNSLKWLDSKDETIPMTIADMDFPLLPEVQQAIRDAAESREFGYKEMGSEDYDAVCNWIKARTGETVPREYIISTPGVLYTMRVAMYALTSPGDKVIVQTPLHTPSIATASMMGRIPVKCPMLYQNGTYTMDYDNLEKCFRNGARVLMMCAPNNPTGRVWKKEELEKVAELVNRYDGYVISDEIHRDIVWAPNQHISPSGMPELADRTVTAFSVSKTFNMGGFHIGSAIIPNREIREKVVRQFYEFGHVCARPSVLDMAAQTAAYTKGEAWYRQMMDYVDRNMDLALEYLDGLPVFAAKPEATFLLWVDINEMGLNTEKLWDVMKNRWKVTADPGSYYDTKDYHQYNGREHHIRLNLATQRTYVEQAFERIRKSFL